MQIRPETPTDVDAIREVTIAAFTGTPHSTLDADGVPIEAGLIDALRADAGWIPSLSLVAEVDGRIVGHVVTTRGYVGELGALGLGPISVSPDQQHRGVGSALMQATIASAGAAGEPLVALLGEPGYYSRFGFVPASTVGIEAPDPAWGAYFQALPLAAYGGEAGAFRYAAPFGEL